MSAWPEAFANRPAEDEGSADDALQGRLRAAFAYAFRVDLLAARKAAGPVRLPLRLASCLRLKNRQITQCHETSLT